MKRENFKSRLGFILISAGCAIGIGNVWKFPYVAGRNGGGIFVLFYLLFLVMVGAPALTMEFAVGRASRKSVLGCYQELEPKGSKWHLHGYAALFGNYVIMMFYTTVAGWMISYFYRFLANDFYGLDTEGVSEKFSNMLADPREMLFWMALIVILGFLICSMGLQNGVEKISKPMMIGLLGLIVILAVNSMMLPGGAEGIKFYLVPNWEQVKKVGLLNVIIAAMNQAFFTLSVGMGGMAIFGSYIGKERSLLGESVNIIVLDTFVAVVAGMIMFPACDTYNLEVTAGPSLLFDTMASVFNHMQGGRWWGALFFLFMVFAAMSTVFGVCENLLAMIRELTGWSRPVGCIACGIGTFLVALTTALGYSLIRFQPFAKGTAWLDLWDFIVSNNAMPLGSLILALFCCTRRGWGWNNFLQEANAGKGLKIKAWMKPLFCYFVPVGILFIYIYGMFTFPWH